MMISPYALLKASKPKTSADFVKPYDLYCAAQHAQSEHVSIDRDAHGNADCNADAESDTYACADCDTHTIASALCSAECGSSGFYCA